MTLSPEKITYFKEKLLAEQIKIKEELSRIAKPTEGSDDYQTEFHDIGSGMDENASEVEEYSDNLALENNLEGRLKEIKEALERIESGTYGFCNICQQEIGIERLEAYPAAKNCIRCN